MDFFNLPCILSCLDIVSLWAYETVFLILSHPPYAPSPAHTRGQLCIHFYQLHNWFAESSSILIRDMSEPIPWAWFPSNRKWRTTRAMRTIYHLQGQIEITTAKKISLKLWDWPPLYDELNWKSRQQKFLQTWATLDWEMNLDMAIAPEVLTLLKSGLSSYTGSVCLIK